MRSKAPPLAWYVERPPVPRSIPVPAHIRRGAAVGCRDCSLSAPPSCSRPSCHACVPERAGPLCSLRRHAGRRRCSPALRLRVTAPSTRTRPEHLQQRAKRSARTSSSAGLGAHAAAAICTLRRGRSLDPQPQRAGAPTATAAPRGRDPVLSICKRASQIIPTGTYLPFVSQRNRFGGRTTEDFGLLSRPTHGLGSGAGVHLNGCLSYERC